MSFSFACNVQNLKNNNKKSITARHYKILKQQRERPTTRCLNYFLTHFTQLTIIKQEQKKKTTTTTKNIKKNEIKKKIQINYINVYACGCI